MLTENDELQKIQLQYLKWQKQISAQNVEKGTIRNKMDKIKNDPVLIEIKDKVKEVEKINQELIAHVDKLG